MQSRGVSSRGEKDSGGKWASQAAATSPWDCGGRRGEGGGSVVGVTETRVALFSVHKPAREQNLWSRDWKQKRNGDLE